MPPDTPKTKVAILGSGVGAMTAAFELTDPSLNGQYDVTVYQLGWRLGGKGASASVRGVKPETSARIAAPSLRSASGSPRASACRRSIGT
jgi:predicted NAD/FAD-binding protein